jgi:hypothetical protein
MKKDEKDRVLKNLDQAVKSINQAWDVLYNLKNYESSASIALCRERLTDTIQEVSKIRCKK